MRTQMWINGQFTAAASGRTLDVLDPATEEVIERVPAGGAADIDAAVSAASAAFPAWCSLGATERTELLVAAARKLTEQTEALAELLTREGGKPLVENRDEMGWSAACFRYYAEIGRNSRGRVIPSGESSQLNLVLKEPYGVVGAIVPWNYPILLMAWKVAPALAAGNTVVIKPSEMTPLSTLAFADIFDHLPPGVVNIVSGYGREAGEPLVLDPRVRVIAFTGSLETGRQIARLASDQMKKLHLELGGKDAFIVAEDADLDIAVPGVAWAALLNTGQVCTSTERVYVHERVSRRSSSSASSSTREDSAGQRAGAADRHGPAHGARTARRWRPRWTTRRRVAPHARGRQASRRRGLLRADGAGGRGPPMRWCARRSLARRPFVASPVDEAIGSPTQPGTASAQTSTRRTRAMCSRRRELQAGTFWINDPLTDNDAGPFGGMKMSGMGRELGEEGLDAFRETKHLHWDFNQTKKATLRTD